MNEKEARADLEKIRKAFKPSKNWLERVFRRKQDNFYIENAWHTNNVLKYILEQHPQLAPEILSIVEESLNFKPFEYELGEIYKTLGDILKIAPELQEKVFEMYKKLFENEQNTDDLLKENYKILKDVLKKSPEALPEAFDVLKAGLKSQQNGDKSLTMAYGVLIDILKIEPSRSSEVFEIVKEDNQKGRYPGSRAMVSAVLGHVMLIDPQFGPEALNIIKNSLSAEKDSSYSNREARETVFQNLAYVGKEKPELVKDIWNIMIDEIKKDKSLDKGDNDFHYDEFRDILSSSWSGGYSEIYGEFRRKVYPIIAEDIRAGKYEPEVLERIMKNLTLSDDEEAKLAILSAFVESTKQTEASLKECYRMIIFNDHSDKEAITDIFVKAIQSEQNSEKTLQEMIEMLIRTESNDFHLDLAKKAVSTRENDKDFLSNLSFSLGKIFQSHHNKDECIKIFEIAEEVLKAKACNQECLRGIQYILKSYVNTYAANHINVHEIFLKVLKKEVNSEANHGALLTDTVDIIKNIDFGNSKQKGEFLELLSDIVKSPQNNGFALGMIYTRLKEMCHSFDQISQDELLSLLSDGLKNPQNNATSLNEMYKILGNMVYQPEYRERILELVQKGLYSGENTTTESVSEGYGILRDLIKKDPRMIDDVFEILDESFEKNPPKRLMCEKTYEVYDAILIRKPKYLEEIWKKVETTYRINKAEKPAEFYALMATIVDLDASKAEAVLKFIQEDSNEPSGEAITALHKIAKARPDLAGQIAETMKDIELWDQKDLTVLKTCMKHLPLADTKAKYPKIEKEIALAHKGRFSTDDEFVYAVETFDHEKILETNILSAEQRVFNILVAKAWVEHNCKSEANKLADEIRVIKQSNDTLLPRDEKEIERLEAERLAWLKQDVSRDYIKKYVEIWKKEALSVRKPQSEWISDKDLDIASAAGWVQTNRDWLLPKSFECAEVFKEYFPAYIKMVESYNQKNPDKARSIHDSVYWLPEPMSEEKNESFVRFIQRNMLYQKNGKEEIRPIEELTIIARNWKYLKPEEEKGKYSAVLSACQSRKYKDQRDVKFAAEAAKHGTPEYNYGEYEDVYLAGLRVPEPFDSSKRFEAGKYVGRFLPRDDVRVGFFGSHTNCCQHFGGIGHACAVSSVKDPYSQLFVIEDERGRIIAGSWVWENTDGNYREVCLDNIEAIGEFKRHPIVNEVYESLGKYLTEEQNCRRVTIGLGYQDADVSKYAPTKGISLPARYSGYTDSRSQRLLAENPNAKPLDKTLESQRYIRYAARFDVKEMEKISEKCFPDSDKQLQIPEVMSGFVIEDRKKGVVGYILYDKDKKEIYDMAVLEEYRKDKNQSSSKLFLEMIKVVKEEGGEWHAELRDKTTLRYMETMEKRGAIKLEKHGVDHQMSDGSQVIKVSFTPIADEIRYALDKTKTKLDSKKPDLETKQTVVNAQNGANNVNISHERE